MKKCMLKQVLIVDFHSETQRHYMALGQRLYCSRFAKLQYSTSVDFEILFHPILTITSGSDNLITKKAVRVWSVIKKEKSRVYGIM